MTSDKKTTAIVLLQVCTGSFDSLNKISNEGSEEHKKLPERAYNSAEY
jgi:hypothetical protein